LLHIAQEDSFVSKDAQQAIIAALNPRQGIEIHSYAGAQHAFARGNGMHYDENAAKLAQARTQKFLNAALRP
jgi:carboxymethylenebutenolidase